MSNFGLIFIGSIVALAVNVGIVYYFVNFTKRKTKSTVLSVLLSAVLGPLIGYAYARPKAWGVGLAAELAFFVPGGIGAALLIQNGNAALGIALAVYLGIAAIVPAVFMAQDQNEQFGGRESVA